MSVCSLARVNISLKRIRWEAKAPASVRKIGDQIHIDESVLFGTLN